MENVREGWQTRIFFEEMHGICLELEYWIETQLRRYLFVLQESNVTGVYGTSRY